MSFSQPSPQPLVMPAPPPPVAPLQPATTKPPRTAMQPTFLGSALASNQQPRSLIGGAPTTFGA